MTQEDKELLLKDLCSRLPYGVKIKFVFNKDIEKINNLIYVSDNEQSYIHNSCMVLTENNIKYVFNDWLDECKPYLRPLSSMTEEEEKEFNKVVYDSMNIDNISASVYVADWLYSKHLDVHGLIPKGLAIEAPEGMYKKGE